AGRWAAPGWVAGRAGVPGSAAGEVVAVREGRARRDPRVRGFERIVVVRRRVLEAALHEADGLAVHDVDRRVEDHATATRAAKLRSRRSPSRDDFSGWNWVAITLPRSTTETKRSPYSLVPTMSVRSEGRQAKLCTW